MHIPLHHPDDLAELDRRIAAERLADQRDRLRAVRLALEGLETRQIMDKLGRGRTFVQNWAYAYRDGGLDAIGPKPIPGRPPRLTPEQQRAFAERFEQGPGEDDVLCTLRGKDAQRMLEEDFGVRYSLSGTYVLLHRIGFSCLKPRPQHRKNDPEAMAEFLDRAPFLSRA